MPKFYGRKFRYKRRRVYRRPGLYRQINYICQRRIEKNQETHFGYNSLSAVGIYDNARSGRSYELTDIDQGDTQYTRTGNSIFVTGFYFRGYLTCADTTNLVRVIMYIPKDPSSVLAPSPQSNLDMDVCTIIYDKLFTLAYQQDTHQRILIIKKKFNRGRKRGIHVQYEDGTGTNVTKNKIMLYFVSDSAAVSDPTIDGQARLYFKDG